MSWASRRRTLYLGGAGFAVIALATWVGFSFFYEVPSCEDGLQNGDEEGVDCGGSCERVCSFQAVDLVVRWQRFFAVAPGVYSALAYVENPNAGTQARSVSYTFKLYDTSGILIKTITGSTAVPQERVLPVFESGIETGERTPARVIFSFDREPTWERAGRERPRVTVSESALSGADSLPRLTATVTNSGTASVADIALVAILSGGDGNAVAASRTVVPLLRPGEARAVVFTWRAPLAAPVTSIDIIPVFPLVP